MAKPPGPTPRDVQPVREGEPALAELSAELETLYSPEYLRDCADAEARRERIDELRRRIRAGAYRIDADRIAEEMLVRGDFG